MAVIDPDAPPERRSSEVGSAASAEVAQPIRVEPLVDLEWMRAVEPTGPIGAARRPSQVRRAWIHRAPEAQVVNLFTAASQVITDLAAPWWLRALAAGRLQSRLGGFAIEDQVSDLLDSRAGWLYMPWAGPGEDGYWEYVPSETTGAARLVPTTLMLTDRHSGWLDVFRAHAEAAPAPLAVSGPAQLRQLLDELERD